MYLSGLLVLFSLIIMFKTTILPYKGKNILIILLLLISSIIIYKSLLDLDLNINNEFINDSELLEKLGKFYYSNNYWTMNIIIIIIMLILILIGISTFL